ncbi:MAG TPA: methyltransferase domain-containing protein [Chloroflexia bacterium]|nr:methyltransferase domain-containing protein [Chloroflexia bacterium]
MAPTAQTRHPPRVLEIGAGTGRVLAPLAAAGAWAVGADLSMAMLRRLQTKQPAGGAGALCAVLSDAHHLPFATGAFDAAVLVHILHLVGPWEPVLAAAQRVVRPGGLLVLGLDEQAPAADDWIERRWVVLVTAAGSGVPPPMREAATRAAVAWLRATGYTMDDAILARWTEHTTPAAILRHHRERAFGTSRDLPQAVLDTALAQLQAELLAAYGSLDAILAHDRAFRVYWTRRLAGPRQAVL